MNIFEGLLDLVLGRDGGGGSPRPARRPSPSAVRPTIGGVPIQGPGLSAADNAQRRRSQGLPTRARNAPNAMSDRQGNATRTYEATRDATNLTRRSDDPIARRRAGNRAAAARGDRPAFTPNLRGLFGLPTTGKDVKPGIRYGDFAVQPKLAPSGSERVVSGLEWFNSRDRPWVMQPFWADDGSFDFDLGELLSQLPALKRAQAAGTAVAPLGGYVANIIGRSGGGPVGPAGLLGRGTRALPAGPRGLPPGAGGPLLRGGPTPLQLGPGPRALPNGPRQAPPIGGWPMTLF